MRPRGFMRPTSRALTGTCGSPRWATWRQYPWVLQVEERLLSGEPDVLALFAGDPFPGHPPEQIRVVLWQYWFTDRTEKREQGVWWRREQIGLYAPTLERTPDGKIAVLEMPDTPQNLR